MKCLELFAGTRSIGKAFEKRGHEVFSVEWDKKHPNIDLYCDIGQLTAKEVLEKFGRPDVVWASPDCFAAGTLVWTSDGYKRIEDVRCFDTVLTHLGNYRKVTGTVKKSSYHNRQVKISGCEEMTVTPNHLFWARRKESRTTSVKGKPVRISRLLPPEWVSAEELVEGEYRVGIPINQNAKIPVWDGFAKEYRNGNGLSRSVVVNSLENKVSNTAFWWVVGRYFADGCLSAQNGTVELCCGRGRDTEVPAFLDTSGLKYTVHEKKTVRSYCLCCMELCVFLSRYGKGAVGKEITKEILDLPIPHLRAFVAGYLAGDGHVECARTGGNKVFHFSTVSRKLAYGMQQVMLKAHGRYCTMVKRPAEKQHGIIEGRHVNCHDSWSLSFYVDENKKRQQYVIEDGYAWVNVRRNEEVRGQISVYCISVDQDESFTADNISVHNCSSYSVAAISHHRDGVRPKTDYAKFCDSVNEHFMDMIKELSPKYWFIENPAGMLQHMPFLIDFMNGQGGRKHLLTYCKYSDPFYDADGNFHLPRQKRTHIFTNHPNPCFLPPCKNGDKCHEAAPRGSKTGTQGLKDSVERSRIPERLCEHIVDICENPPPLRPEDIDLFSFIP